jgi:hypothetical protein
MKLRPWQLPLRLPAAFCSANRTLYRVTLLFPF